MVLWRSTSLDRRRERPSDPQMRKKNARRLRHSPKGRVCMLNGMYTLKFSEYFFVMLFQLNYLLKLSKILTVTN